MKRYFLFIALLLLISKLNAQKKVSQHYTIKGINNVFINLKYAKNIEVKNWNKNKVLVQATVNINNNKDNDFFILKSKKNDKELSIKSDYATFFKSHNNNVVLANKNKDCECNCNTIVVNYTICIPSKMDLTIKSMSGNVNAESYNGNLSLNLISGNITIKKHSNKMVLKTISGDIDIFISDAFFKAKTLTGNIYSNLEINFNKNKLKSFGQEITGKVKKGTSNLNLKTISGDIFLRKM